MRSLLLDFDETLGCRPRRRFETAVLDILRQEMPGLGEHYDAKHVCALLSDAGTFVTGHQ